MTADIPLGYGYHYNHIHKKGKEFSFPVIR
jgi:hypothetical protein